MSGGPPAVPAVDLVAAVTAVQVRYATGIDRRDWPALRSCFTDDCDADYGEIGRWHGGDEITEWMRAAHEPAGPTLHRMTNHTVLGTSVGADGRERCTARCSVDAIVLGPDGRSGVNAIGCYDDELVRTDQGWRIAGRRFTQVLLRTVPDGTVL